MADIDKLDQSVVEPVHHEVTSPESDRYFNAGYDVGMYAALIRIIITGVLSFSAGIGTTLAFFILLT